MISRHGHRRTKSSPFRLARRFFQESCLRLERESRSSPEWFSRNPSRLWLARLQNEHSRSAPVEDLDEPDHESSSALPAPRERYRSGLLRRRGIARKEHLL